MIILDEYLEIPGKQFDVKIQCVAIRRLTTMEWLIINCTKQYIDSPNRRNMTLKQVFEDIFCLTSSEILIKPCIESLLKENAILLDVDSNYNYAALDFTQIRLTEKGKRMAEDGLFPGESHELPIKVYYNPLTKKINQFPTGREKIDGVLEFGVESDYDMNFPKEIVIEGLHKGTVEQGKFIASRQRIEDIECLYESEWKSFLKLTVDLDEKGVLRTNPIIRDEGIKNRVHELFVSKDLSVNKVKKLPCIEEADVWKILGSGKRIKEEILQLCKNSTVLAVSDVVWTIIRNNKKLIAGKSVLVFDSDKWGFEKDKNTLIFKVPQSFSVVGCCMINEKSEALSLCKGKYLYESQEIVVPLVFRDRKIVIGDNLLTSWVQNVVEQNLDNEFEYFIMFLLPVMEATCKISELLRRRWSKSNISKILEEITLISAVSKKLELSMFSLEGFEELLWSKLLEDEDGLQTNLYRLMQQDCVKREVNLHKFLVISALSFLQPPKNYSEFHQILRNLGIGRREEAIVYEKEIAHFYTKELIVDVMAAIMNDKFTSIPEYFAMDLFFKQYNEAIKKVELLISGLRLFEKMDLGKMKMAIDNCVDLALLQETVSQIIDKNASLISYGVNLYSELNFINENRAKSYFDNLKLIKASIASIEENVVLNTGGQEVEKVDRKMYIIDTCALIHEPDILLCLKDDEYVRIPTKVIDELGKIKDNKLNKYKVEDSTIARKLAYDIEIYYRKLFNKYDKTRFMIENAPIELLPIDLDPKVPDNQILSVALKYKSWETYIVSDDGVFRLASLSQNIQALKGVQFMESHKEYRKTLYSWVNELEDVKTVSEEETSISGKQVQIDLETNDDSLLEIDKKNLKELKPYISELRKDNVFTMLSNNKIKTIGDFRKMTPQKIEGLKARGQQSILKNEIKRAFEKLPEAIQKLKI